MRKNLWLFSTDTFCFPNILNLHLLKPMDSYQQIHTEKQVYLKLTIFQVQDSIILSIMCQKSSSMAGSLEQESSCRPSTCKSRWLASVRPAPCSYWAGEAHLHHQPYFLNLFSVLISHSFFTQINSFLNQWIATVPFHKPLSCATFPIRYELITPKVHVFCYLSFSFAIYHLLKTCICLIMVCGEVNYRC